MRSFSAARNAAGNSGSVFSISSMRWGMTSLSVSERKRWRVARRLRRFS
jgi:hypothetical protein